MTKDELKQRELYVIEQLRKGHTRRWVAAHLEEEYDLAPSTAIDVVNQIGAKLNKDLEGLSQDAAEYIYNTLLSTIDDTITDNDRKSRLKALELLAKVCKVGDTKPTTDLNIHFDFDR